MIASVENICVSFKKKINGHNETVKVLKDISFNIRAREVIGLVGESGCGKSTLAKTIIGLQIPDSGEVIQKFNHPQMIFQDPYGSLNPAKNIRFILEEPLKNLRKMTKEEMESTYLNIKLVYEILGE